MRVLQPITWPAGAKQMDAWLAFLDDPERYKLLHDALRSNLEEINRLVEKLGLEGDINAAREAAVKDRNDAKQLLDETKLQIAEARTEQAADKKRAAAVTGRLEERAREVDRLAKAHTTQVAKHAKEYGSAMAELDTQREAVAKAQAKAETLQYQAREAMDRIKQFKEAV